MKISKILGLAGIGLLLGAGASAQTNPFGREIRLTPRIDPLGKSVAELVKANPNKIKSLGGYGTEAVYGREVWINGLKYEVLFTDRNYSVAGINSYPIGPNDALELRISNLGELRYRFVDNNIDGTLEFSKLPYEEEVKISAFDRLTIQQKRQEIYSRKLLETLLILSEQRD
jgi:hypothetical protein